MYLGVGFVVHEPGGRGLWFIKGRKVIEIMKERYYRIGHVLKQVESNLGCCHHTYVNCVMFDYVEVVYEDGLHKFFYEDEGEFEHFERNFVSKRFTSYHEFFTTDKLAVEDRGFMKLNYYVRLDNDSYEKVDLKAKESELDAMAENKMIEKVNDRITMYGEYDTTVNNHWDEDVSNIDWVCKMKKDCGAVSEYGILC